MALVLQNLVVSSTTNIGSVDTFPVNTTALNSTIKFTSVGTLTNSYMSRQVGKPLSLYTFTTSTFNKFITKGMLGVATTTGIVSKRLNKIISTISSVVPSVVTKLTFTTYRTLSVVSSVTASVTNSVTRFVLKTLSVVSPGTIAIQKQVSKTIGIVSNVLLSLATLVRIGVHITWPVNFNITSAVTPIVNKNIQQTYSVITSVTSSVLQAVYRGGFRIWTISLTVVSKIPIGGFNTNALNNIAVDGSSIFTRIGTLATNSLNMLVIKPLSKATVTNIVSFITQRNRTLTTIINTTASFTKFINKTISYVSNMLITLLIIFVSFRILNNERVVYFAKRISTITTTRIRTLYYTLKNLGQ